MEAAEQTEAAEIAAAESSRRTVGTTQAEGWGGEGLDPKDEWWFARGAAATDLAGALQSRVSVAAEASVRRAGLSRSDRGLSRG